MALNPYVSAGDTPGAAKTAELNGKLYWGTLMLGKGCYPQTTILSMYDASTKILNLSGGATGLTMPTVWNTDIWGGNTHQPTTVYIHGQPVIQFDVSPVKTYQVTIQAAAQYMANVPYTVTVTAVNGTGAVPRDASGSMVGLINHTATFSTNNAGSTWGAGGYPTIRFSNSGTGTNTTTIRFGTVKANTYINVTDTRYNYATGGSAVPSPAPPASTQAVVGSLGPIVVLIPEFATVLIPIVGVMAMFFIFRTKKRKREE